MILRLHLRHSVGRRALLLIGATFALHLSLHGTEWRHEWLWTLFEFNFVTVFLGPLVAGIAVVEGATWAKATALEAKRSSPRRMLLMLWGGLVAYTVGPFLLVASAVSLLVHLGGLPDWPSGRDVLVLIPACALLSGWLAAGLALGWASRNASVVAPLVAAGAFAFTILAYAALPGHLVDVGGSTASLLGLRVRTAVSLQQTLFWFAIAATALLFVGGGFRRRSMLWAGLPLVVAVAAYLPGTHGQRDLMEPHPAGLGCRGTPLICLGPGYERDRPNVIHALQPSLSVMGNYGVTPPVTFTQDSSLLGTGAGYIDDRLLAGQANAAFSAVITALLPGDCDPIESAPTSQAANALQNLLEHPFPHAALVQNPALHGQLSSAMQQAVRTIRRCGRP